MSKRAVVILDDAVMEKLKELQMQRGHLTVSETIRAILGEYLAELEKEMRAEPRRGER